MSERACPVAGRSPWLIPWVVFFPLSFFPFFFFQQGWVKGRTVWRLVRCTDSIPAEGRVLGAPSMLQGPLGRQLAAARDSAGLPGVTLGE